MAPTQRKKGPRSETFASTSKPGASDLEPPGPFRRAAPYLAPLLDTLDRRRVYLAHVDTKPASFKRQVFAVPVIMNLALVALFIWRLLVIGPWYWHLVTNTTPDQQAAPAAWSVLAWLVLRRASTFMVDFMLFAFVWPWPLEFAFGVRGPGGCPAAWRWAVGFRDAELCLRCSRREWDRDGRTAQDALARLDITAAAAARGAGNNNNKNRGGKGREDGPEYRADYLSGDDLLWRIDKAMKSTRLREKTAYLLIDADWDLAWAAMVRATRLVDDKTVTLDDLRGVVFLYDESHGGWLRVMLGMDGLGGGGPGARDDEDDDGGSDRDDERRRQVLKFRDALVVVGKEDLFFRWIEVIQFETSRPEGFTVERQVAVARDVRELFQSNGIDFDRLWAEAVGSETADGLLSKGALDG